MAPSRKRTPIPGSEKKAVPNAKVVGDVDPGERIEVTVVLRRDSRESGPGPRARRCRPGPCCPSSGST